MNLIPDKIGGNRKQFMWLGGLVVVLAVVYFIQREPSAPATPATAVTVKQQPSISRAQPVVLESSVRLRREKRGRDDNFSSLLNCPGAM
jgi:hypothetical protein